MKASFSMLCVVIISYFMSPKAAGDIHLQNGNLLLLSGNVLVQVDRTGEVIDGSFLPFSAFDVGLDVNGRMLIAATDVFHSPITPIRARGVKFTTCSAPVPDTEMTTEKTF